MRLRATLIAVVACAMYAATAPVRPVAAAPLDTAPDAQEKLPLPQGFLLTRGVLTLSAPSDAGAPASKAAPLGVKKVAKKGSKKPTSAAPTDKPAELKESAMGRRRRRRRRRKKNSAEKDPTNPLNPAVAATLLNNAAAVSSGADAANSKTEPSITMHVKGIKVLVNPQNNTNANETETDDPSAVVAPAVAANKAAWPQDTSEKDFEKNGKHSEGFPKDHKKREDWRDLTGASLLAPPNETAIKKPTAVHQTPGLPKVTAATKKAPAAKKRSGQKEPGATTMVTARSLVTRVSPMPPLAGWDAAAPVTAAGKPAGMEKPAAKPPTKQKKPSTKKKATKAATLGEMAKPKPAAKPASKAKPAAKPASKEKAAPKPVGAVQAPAPVGQQKPTRMGSTQCKSITNGGHLCSTTHSWAGYQCKGSDCKSSNCRCHATKMASCTKKEGGGITCSTGNVVTSCGSSKVKSVVESACCRGAEGLL